MVDVGSFDELGIEDEDEKVPVDVDVVETVVEVTGEEGGGENGHGRYRVS